MIIDCELSLDKNSQQKLISLIIRDITDQIFKELAHNKRKIEQHLRDHFELKFLQSPEVASLLDDTGKLYLELGVKDSADSITQIVEYIKKNIVVNISKKKSGFDFIITVSFNSVGEYDELCNQAYAYYQTKNGTKVDWLKWLLLAGNSDVVFNYKIRYGVDLGRTGGAIMMPTQTANWRVPLEFSGTDKDNFITRSFDGIEKELENIVAVIVEGI